MHKNNLILLFSIILILLIIPSVSAQDNDTVSLDADLNASTITASNDIYFDSNASDDCGDGTPDSPYKDLRDGRILDDSVIHLKNGEYAYSQANSHSDVSFIGEDASKTIINGNGGTLRVDNRLILSDVTICNLNIINQGTITASNTLFINSSAKPGSYGYSFGGAIYSADSRYNVYLNNCTFINNHAGHGGAIYLNGGVLEVNDCVFINNTALNYGGAIAYDSKNSKGSTVTIKRSKFIQDQSVGDAGGAIYLKSARFIGEYLNITSCSATFGGALTLLKTQSDLNNLYAYNNTAKYEGGAIYQVYGNLTLNNADISNNNAKNGAGFFIDNSNNSCLDNVHFINNSAIQLAGAMYLLVNENFNIKSVTYLNNTASEYDDLYEQKNASAIFLSGNYTLYNNLADDSPLPSYYSSVDMGYVTPAKNQQDGGNCWAFATLAALESSLLKASGGNIDLSEENMKNLASSYSHYGWKMDANGGGYDDMALGYLTSWLGPVMDIDDPYNYLSAISPVLDSIAHVQNILFLQFSGPDDMDTIKRAIRDYGAVYSPIFMTAHYDYKTGKYVQCYRGSSPCDHAVALVGWDDDFYITGAPGKGAWIAKNSWGSSWGNNGYFYVSYFDESCPKRENNEGALVFIFNDTLRYDKNYQYDVAKTDYFFNTTNTVWYKNIFTATDNEYLAAVSTYFDKNTRWEFSIYVNSSLKAAKSGTSPSGYLTFNLDELIPLNAGDIFEVVFKITVNGDAGVPISEIISLNNLFYHENISYISYDGKNWKDLFKLTWKYPDHTYDSQVACIKAFTILNPVNSTILLAIENRTDSSFDIVAQVLNQWGYPVSCGNVTFRFDGNNYTVELNNGMAKKSINISEGNITVEFNAVGYISTNITAEIRNPLVNTTISLNITGNYNPINITAHVVDNESNPVMYGRVIFTIAGERYTVNVSNGTARLENMLIIPTRFNITAVYNEFFYYQASNITQSVEILRNNTEISLQIINMTEANNPVEIIAHVMDSNGNPVNSGFVIFVVSNENYIVEVEDGLARIDHTFSKTGNNTVFAYYDDVYFYNSSSSSESLNVSKIKVNLTMMIIIDEDSVTFRMAIENAKRGFEIALNVNDRNYSYSSTEGSVVAKINNLEYGSYDYTIKLISPIYEADDLTGRFNITYRKTQIIAYDSTLNYNGEYVVVLKDASGNVLPDKDIYLRLDGKIIKKRTDSQGIAVFKFALSSGQYSARIEFVGDDKYIRSSKTTKLSFKSSVDFVSYVYATNSNYQVTLYGSNGKLLSNRLVNVVVNGVNYYLNTDNNGHIAFNFNLNPGFYSVQVTNPDTDEVSYQTINVVKRITENKGFTMYYGAGKSYKVRVCDDFGNFISGLKVTFKIKGKTHYAYTNSNGYASFKISLKPGKYTITASYNGIKVSNKITVKSTIITKDIKVKKGKAIKFTAKLVNKKGKILKGKKITFRFKGKTYKVKTNKKGKAVLKITKKYKKGKYTITSKYGKLSVKNKITIK